jgi:Ca2+-binding EF-hand superfamily protein
MLVCIYVCVYVCVQGRDHNFLAAFQCFDTDHSLRLERQELKNLLEVLEKKSDIAVCLCGVCVSIMGTR